MKKKQSRRTACKILRKWMNYHLKWLKALFASAMR